MALLESRHPFFLIGSVTYYGNDIKDQTEAMAIGKLHRWPNEYQYRTLLR